jgi:hypothetical protein
MRALDPEVSSIPSDLFRVSFYVLRTWGPEGREPEGLVSAWVSFPFFLVLRFMKPPSSSSLASEQCLMGSSEVT